MKGQQGKSPAVQWYYKDWLSDRELQRANPSTRGIWMNLLMHMIDCSTDGKNCKEGVLEDLTISELMQLGSCTEDDAWTFIDDALKHNFCNIELDKNRTFHIMSRRLARDHEKRDYWRKIKRLQRQQEYDKKECPTNVQPNSTVSPIPTPTPTPNINKDIVVRIITYLNKKTGKNFKPSTDKTVKLIKARFREKFTLEDFKTVIDNQTAKWLYKPDMVDYLRPETLFGTKFESYLQSGPAESKTQYESVAPG